MMKSPADSRGFLLWNHAGFSVRDDGRDENGDGGGGAAGQKRQFRQL